MFRSRASAAALGVAVLLCVLVLLSGPGTSAQDQQFDITAALPNGGVVFDTYEQHKVRVSIVTTGLSHPWAMAFLPNDEMLITERADRTDRGARKSGLSRANGALRIVRKGVLDSRPVQGVPIAYGGVGSTGLLDIALHPKFTENHLVYLSYTKGGAGGPRIALAQGIWNGSALIGTRDVFEGEPWDPKTDDKMYERATGGSRIAFGHDGTIYMTTSAWVEGDNRAQQVNKLAGKVLRLRDDGTVPPDNPLLGRAGESTEIYTVGHRDSMGLTVHPVTGAVWESEAGPNGGDEVNILEAGHNYGWPVVSYGRWYNGPRVSPAPWKEEFDLPAVVWVPSITPSGMTFYTGDKFPRWKGNLFVGSLRYGEIPHTGRVQRIVFNARNEELRREDLPVYLHQRIRDVREGPDGFIYILTEEDDAALLRLEPAAN
jgi:aldose sugar dehydrogenase